MFQAVGLISGIEGAKRIYRELVKIAQDGRSISVEVHYRYTWNQTWVV